MRLMRVVGASTIICSSTLFPHVQVALHKLPPVQHEIIDYFLIACVCFLQLQVLSPAPLQPHFIMAFTNGPMDTNV